MRKARTLSSFLHSVRDSFPLVLQRVSVGKQYVRVLQRVSVGKQYVRGLKEIYNMVMNTNHSPAARDLRILLMFYNILRGLSSVLLYHPTQK